LLFVEISYIAIEWNYLDFYWLN